MADVLVISIEVYLWSVQVICRKELQYIASNCLLTIKISRLDTTYSPGMTPLQQ